MKTSTLNLSITLSITFCGKYKKIKFENQKILDKIKDMGEDIDISEHEVHKFLLIFHTLVKTVYSDLQPEETDDFVADAILQIVNTIAGILKNNIDSLNTPLVLKSTLRKLKSLFIPQTIDKEEGKTGELETKEPQLQNEIQEASEASRNG